MSSLDELLKQSKPIIYDGATGTFLQQLGLPSHTAPESWVLDNPAMVLAAAEAYVNAGAQIILTNTFGGTAFRLREAGLEYQAEEINRRAAQLAQEAAHGRALIAGCMGPLGYIALKLGTISYTDAVLQFAAQAKALADGGADLLHIEAMSDLEEVQAAIAGARQATNLPIVATLSFDKGGKTLLDVTPTQAAQALVNQDVAAMGASCGAGPWDMPSILREMRSAIANAILIAKPNAGIPEHRNGQLVYPADVKRFAMLSREWVRAGAKIIGGCCGTTPEYIAMSKSEIVGRKSAAGESTIIF